MGRKTKPAMPKRQDSESAASKPMGMSMRSRICCDHVIEPRLIEVPNPYGMRLSIAVLHCPKCGEMAAQYIQDKKRPTLLAYTFTGGQRVPQHGRAKATKSMNFLKRKLYQLS